jgi:hypothetical protein
LDDHVLVERLTVEEHVELEVVPDLERGRMHPGDDLDPQAQRLQRRVGRPANGQDRLRRAKDRA